MRTEWKEPEVPVPAQLDAVVEESLREVGKLRRRRLARRAGTVLGSVMAFVGAFLVFGFCNPALASQIPLVGGLFRQANAQSKMPGATQIEGYGAVQPVGKRAETENEDCSLTITEAYSDGRTVQIGLRLDAPDSFAQRYCAVGAGYGRDTTARIGGEEARVVIVNPFYLREGEWTATVSLEVPESQRERNELEISLTLDGLSGQVKGENGAASSKSDPLEGPFTAEFPVSVDRAHEFAFSCDAQDNGAKLFSVSGTPAQTVLSVERPGWGEVHPNVPEDGALGYPVLYTMDGEKAGILADKSREEGGWDYTIRETLDADLYFDGLPAGTKRAVFRFCDSNQQERVLAEFTIDLEKQSAAPSRTYEENGPLMLREPTHYEILQEGHDGEEQNGYSVRSIVFSNLQTRYAGGLSFSFPGEKEGGSLRAELLDSRGTLVFSSDSRREDGTWNEEWHLQEGSEYAEEDENGGKVSCVYPTQYIVSVPLAGERVPVGETVTARIVDLETGQTVCTDTRTLDSVQY